MAEELDSPTWLTARARRRSGPKIPATRFSAVRTVLERAARRGQLCPGLDLDTAVTSVGRTVGGKGGGAGRDDRAQGGDCQREGDPGQAARALAFQYEPACQGSSGDAEVIDGGSLTGGLILEST